MLAFTSSLTVLPNPNAAVPLTAVLIHTTNIPAETPLPLPIVGMEPDCTYYLRVASATNAKYIEHPDTLTFTTPPKTVFDVCLRLDTAEPNIGWVCFGAEKIESLL